MPEKSVKISHLPNKARSEPTRTAPTHYENPLFGDCSQGGIMSEDAGRLTNIPSEIPHQSTLQQQKRQAV
jgi:hypothetical protein